MFLGRKSPSVNCTLTEITSASETKVSQGDFDPFCLSIKLGKGPFMNSVPDPFSLPCSIISFTNILKHWQQKNQRQLWVRGVQRAEITNIVAGMYLWYFLPPKALPSFKGKYFRVPANFESSRPISSKRRKHCRNVRVSSAPRKIGSILEMPNNCLPVPWSQGKTRSGKRRPILQCPDGKRYISSFRSYYSSCLSVVCPLPLGLFLSKINNNILRRCETPSEEVWFLLCIPQKIWLLFIHFRKDVLLHYQKYYYLLWPIQIYRLRLSTCQTHKTLKCFTSQVALCLEKFDKFIQTEVDVTTYAGYVVLYWRVIFRNNFLTLLQN